MTPPSMPSGRWYDQDPVLKNAMEALRQAPDRYQAQIALNIIMISLEHQIESETLGSVEALIEHLESSISPSREHRRWYDASATIRSAIQMLHDCPDEVQPHVIGCVATLVEETLAGCQ